MRKIIISLVMLIGLVASLSAETVKAIKSSDCRTYTLAEVDNKGNPNEPYLAIAVHNNDYYYDECEMYLFLDRESALDTYRFIWDTIAADNQDQDNLVVKYVGTLQCYKFSDNFDYIKRDNGSSGYLRMKLYSVID